MTYHWLWQGDFTPNRKQAQDPPGSPHTIVSLVEWCSLRWFAVRKTMWLTKCDLTCTHKEVTNRLKIPQGLSTLLFRRWSEGSPRGGVHCDSPCCFINTSLFNFILHNLSQLCKDGVMSNHSVFVFISGPIAGGPAMTLWRLVGRSPLLWTTSLGYVNFLLLLMSTFLLHLHMHTIARTHTHTHFSQARASF